MNFSVVWQEFICPTCQRLCNNTVPIPPPLSAIQPFAKADQQGFDAWLAKTTQFLKTQIVTKPDGKVWEPKVEISAAKYFEHLRIKSKRPDKPNEPLLPRGLCDMVIMFGINITKKILGVNPSEDDCRMVNLSAQILSMAIHLSQTKNDFNFDDPIIELYERDRVTLKSLAVSIFCLPFAGPKTSKTVSVSWKCSLWKDGSSSPF